MLQDCHRVVWALAGRTPDLIRLSFYKVLCAGLSIGSLMGFQKVLNGVVQGFQKVFLVGFSGNVKLM